MADIHHPYGVGMTLRRIRERVAETQAAAQLLCDTRGVLSLAAEAVASACPRGFVLSFTRRTDNSYGCAAAHFEGVPVPRQALSDRPSTHWIVDIDRVPDWQRNRWIEPINAGVHGPDYFSASHPASRLFGGRATLDYGRMMVCHDSRLVAWIGLMMDGRYGFTATEQRALVEVSTQLALPLRIAAALDDDVRRIPLAPRQTEILSGVALGWTNKRIARELHISPATVKTTLERLFRVSGCENRAALVEWWRQG
jgi:DNA-binding CsgD family transcriptional regulator